MNAGDSEQISDCWSSEAQSAERKLAAIFAGHGTRQNDHALVHGTRSRLIRASSPCWGGRHDPNPPPQKRGYQLAPFSKTASGSLTTNLVENFTVLCFIP